jgi:hypothetical protein
MFLKTIDNIRGFRERRTEVYRRGIGNQKPTKKGVFSSSLKNMIKKISLDFEGKNEAQNVGVLERIIWQLSA